MPSQCPSSCSWPLSCDLLSLRPSSPVPRSLDHPEPPPTLQGLPLKGDTQIKHHSQGQNNHARPSRVLAGGRRYTKGMRKGGVLFCEESIFKRYGIKKKQKPFNNPHNTLRKVCLLNTTCNSMFSCLGSGSALCLQLLSFSPPNSASQAYS